MAGKRYGKGSSREHSPAAEKLAGIQLVIAESFERIYRQNADNIGLFTSTDLGLVARIQRGDVISVEELVADRDALAASILRSGGLLRFGQLHMGAVRVAAPSRTTRPQTLFEKIIGRHALNTSFTSAGDVQSADIQPGGASAPGTSVASSTKTRWRMENSRSRFNIEKVPGRSVWFYSDPL